MDFVLTVLGINALAVIGLVLGVLSHPGISRRIEKLLAKRRALRTRSYYTPEMRSSMDEVETYAHERLYYFPGGWARAIRLWGADGQNARASEVTIEYVHQAFARPPELIEMARAFIEKSREEALKLGKKFFDGPNTRLIAWSANPIDGPGVARERESVTLTTGPVGWYDYTGLNDALSVRQSTGLLLAYRYFAGLDELLRKRSVSASKLSNILDTATTILTRDGFVAYQLRSDQVSTAASRITSSVAENINRWMDDSEQGDCRKLRNPEWARSRDDQPDNTYVPSGVPHPFAAVSRGLQSEVSPRLVKYLCPGSIRLTGLSFDLEAMHSDALFVAFIDATRFDVEAAHLEEPGDEHHEGVIKFVVASFDDDETVSLMKDPKWTGAGLASFIRAIQVVDAARRDNRWSYAEAFSHFLKPSEHS
jgi:hypothetical protein